MLPPFNVHWNLAFAVLAVAESAAVFGAQTLIGPA